MLSFNLFIKSKEIGQVFSIFAYFSLFGRWRLGEYLGRLEEEGDEDGFDELYHEPEGSSLSVPSTFCYRQ